MTGGGIFALPILGIFGFYFFQNRYLRTACLIVSIGWILILAASAVVKNEWILLVFPAIVGILWAVIHPLLKEG
jgi:hypothetical protein